MSEKTEASAERWAGDTKFEDSTITCCEGNAERGWDITKADGWSFWVPSGSPVEPMVGMSVRMYGNGIGSVVRGLFLDGQCVFYRTEAEQVEYAAEQAYGKDAADLLKRWDEGLGVWSIAMGGFGPGYEQALQVAAFEVLRHLVSGGDLDTADTILPSLSYLGLSGAQWGAARSLANGFHIDGPRKVHEGIKSERHIQVSKNFPSPALAALLAASKVVLAGLNARIDRAHPSGVPVFDGIADLHDAIGRAEARS